MQALPVILFSTFVAAAVAFSSPALAAKETPAPDLGDAVPAGAPPSSTNSVEESTLDLGPKTAPPKTIVSSEGPSYFHALHNGLTLHVGTVSNSSPETISVHSQGAPALAGFRLMGTTDANWILEGGADAMTDGTGALEFSRRWIFGQEAFRPYVKLGLGLWVNPEDQLAAFIDLEHFRLLGGAGFEMHIEGRSSLRFEIEGGLGWPSVQPFPSQIGAKLGWVWGW